MQNRCALYARYSSNLQRDRSIEDQLALCREHARRLGASVVAEYADRARTGSTVFGREQLARLMEDGKARRFDIVVVEALDRLSRDQEDLAAIYKRLSFADVRIEAVHDGAADAVQIGVRGMLGTMFLSDLKHKIRRGMKGVVRDGRHAGGRAYGYRPTLGVPGQLVIVEDEAEVVRGIFRDYLNGHSPRSIAHALNAKGVRPPRGKAWTGSTINGNGRRGSGILLNPLYAGRLAWNRVTMVRDPETGRRISRPNPESEWQWVDVPGLAIVDAATFAAANARKRERGEALMRGEPLIRTRRLLSGLMRCGVCGGSIVTRGRDRGGIRVGCSAHKEAGTCSHGRGYYAEKIERFVVQSLSKQFASRAALNLYVKAYREERAAAIKKARASLDRLERQMADAEAALARLVEAVARGTLPPDLVDKRARELRAERDRLAIEIEEARVEVPVVDLHPQAVARYREDLADLARGIEAAPEAAESLRSLISEVIVHPAPPGEIKVEVRGWLSALTEPSALALVAEVRCGRQSRQGSIKLVG